MAVHYLGDNGPDGVGIGLSATEKVGFFGATPVAQQSVTAATTTATTTLHNVTLQSLQTALVNLGLIVTT